MLVDLACGTGIVTRRLLHPTRRVIGVDRSPGMLALASRRLPQSVILADATNLPIGSASVDAVVIIWLLHLLPDAAPVLAETSRVLRPGGVLITTVDKNEAPFTNPSDVATVTQQARKAYSRNATDGFDRVIAQAASHGLRPLDETTFPGTGQGRTPRHWREQILADRMPWFREPHQFREPDRSHNPGPSPNHDPFPNPGRVREPDRVDEQDAADLGRALSALPDQDLPRPDPVYRLIALNRTPPPS